MAKRIPFEEAITEKLLLKERFSQLSLPQQVALKGFYGVPLTPEEIDIWSMFHNHATYDHLGFPVGIDTIDYTPMEYSQAWLVFGRRSGKTDTFSATVLAYEATCGGHEEYIRKGAQQAVCFLVSQDLRTARENLPLIYATITSSPLLKKELKKEPTADWIEFKNGLSIACVPPIAKAVRGYACPVVAMDEIGVWYTDAESANPDYEVERAVRYSQRQFPHYKRVGTSTPYIKDGLLWKYHEAGTGGWKIKDQTKRLPFRKVMVLHATTAAMTGAISGGLKRPIVNRDSLQEEFIADPDAFQREALALFSDSISGFFNTGLVRGAVTPDIFEREPLPRATHPNDPVPMYVAALDPAFKRDAFGFVIVHKDGDGNVVVDVARRWKAVAGEVLNPTTILNEIKPLLKAYRIPVVYSDQYHLESLQQLAIMNGFSIEGVSFTAKSKASIYGNLQQIVNRQKLRLLDTHGFDPAGEMINELITIERRLTSQGGVQISAPVGKHDDMASVLALATEKATWMMPTFQKATPTQPSHHDRILAQIRKKRLNREQTSDIWD